MAVDICIDFKNNVFVDTVFISPTPLSAFSSIEIFDKSENKLKKSAKYIYCENKQDIVIPVGIKSSGIVIRVNGSYSDFGIQNLEISAMSDMENAIYPIPNECNFKKGDFDFNGAKICALSPEAEFAGKYLSELIKEKCGAELLLSKTEGKIKLIKDLILPMRYMINYLKLIRQHTTDIYRL